MEVVGQSYMIRGDELLVKIAKIEWLYRGYDE